MNDQSFPRLVMRIATEKHDGNLLAMSQRSRIPQSSLWRWSHGLAQVPRLELLQRFCNHYGLSFTTVWALVSRDVQRVAAGREVPLPDFSDRKPGPKAKLADGMRRKR